jgi:hypothetical protein
MKSILRMPSKLVTVFFSVVCMTGLMKAQTTTISTNFTNNNSNFLITFNFVNNNATPMIITDIASYSTYTGVTSAELWYKPGAINGSPGSISAGNGWTQAASQPVTVAAGTLQTMMTNVNLTVPAGTTYGLAFCIQGGLSYSTISATTYTFSGGGCDLVTGSNIGYGGGVPPNTPVNTPRGFIGSISFVSPCTGTPAPGNTISSANPVCPGTGFSLSVQNTQAPGTTFQWQSSPDGNTWTNIPSATNPTYQTSITTATYYQCNVTCTNSGMSATSASTSVTVLPAVNASISASSNVSCNGSNDGDATVSASGGTGGLTYSWSPSGGTAATASGLAAGAYTCTVTDANSCSATTTLTVSEPTVLTASSTAGNISCNGGTTTVTVSANGGTPSYTGDGTFTVTAGTYTYAVTDANSCATTTTLTVTEPTVLSVNSTAGTIQCNGGVTTVTVSANGGTPAYMGGGTFTVTAGTYTYSVTDNNGCVATSTVDVTEPAAITSSQAYTLCAGGSITVGTNTYTATGTYTDLFTAFNGCDSTVTTNLIVENAIDTTTSVTGPVITVNTAGASYQWIDCNNGKQAISGETSQSYTASASGSYACIITVNNCSDTTSCIAVSSTGIASAHTNVGVLIYPNPNEGVFTIESGDELGTIEVYDMLSRLTYATKVSGTRAIINLDDAIPGIYYVRVKGKMLKVIKE